MFYGLLMTDIEDITAIVREAVHLEMSSNNGRYIDISRVPLLCQAIIGIDKKLEEMVTQKEFWPVKTLVYGAVAVMLLALVSAIILLVLPHAQFS